MPNTGSDQSSRERIQCLNPEGEPIRGFVEFVFDPKCEQSLHTINEYGFVDSPTGFGKPPVAVAIKPTDGHWPILAGMTDGASRFICPKIELPDAALWWRDLSGSSALTFPGRACRVGVIDIAARCSRDMRHMALFDIEGRPLSENDLPFASHGLAVSSMIAERGDIPERRGIASECNITFIDVSQDHNRVNWDFDKIRPAIDILVDEFEVDIINISGGSPLSLDDFRFPNVSRYYQEAVKYATNAGVLIVAAAGNKSYLPVALPARLPEVIGVGAIGRVGLAPKTSSTHDCQIKAQRSKGCYGTYGHTAFFHHVYTSYGDGMDMVGPGIGVVLGYEDGSVAEYDGTSYAAPYVTGVAACAFADVPGIGDVTGPQKHQTLRDHVLGLCKHLQMDPSRQGAGLPVLNEANLAGSIRT